MSHPARWDRDRLSGGALAIGLEPTEAELDRLSSFARLLATRAVPLGMIARGDAERIPERHVLDSLRAVPVIRRSRPDIVVDLGSGAGLPGIPVAISVPGSRVILAESRSRRAAFLELAVQELGLRNAEVHAGRAEDLPGGVGACTARAFAPPAEAWAVARELLRPGGFLLLFAGRGWGGPDRVGPLPGGATVIDPPPEALDEGSAGGRVRPEWLESGGPLVMITRT